MKKSGFTVVELLAVLVIIAILGFITIPIVNKAVINSKTDSYNIQIKTLEKALLDFSIRHIECMPKTSYETLTLSLGELKNGIEANHRCYEDDGGYVEKNIKNPLTNKLFSDDTILTITKYANNYLYNVILDNFKSKEDLPTIILDGKNYYELAINSSFDDPLAHVLDKNGEVLDTQINKIIKQDNVQVDSIDFTIGGTYEITYEANVENKKLTTKRTVIIKEAN